MKFFKVIIFIISILFLVYVGINNFNGIKESVIFERNSLKLEIFILSIVYAISLTFVAMSWKKILNLLSKDKLPFSLVWVWLKSNLYKYLPGNVFNYVSRQFVSKKMGLSHKVLLQSNVVEAILIISTAIIISGVILLLIYDFTVNEYFSFINSNYIYIICLFIIVVFWYLHKYKQIKVTDYWECMIYYSVFFILIGVSAYYVLNYQMNIEFPFLLITAIYTFAWLVGFITPGAPGGIGVRESVFVFLSHGILGEPDAIVLSGMLRFISLLGEIILFFVANKMLNKSEMVNNEKI